MTKNPPFSTTKPHLKESKEVEDTSIETIMAIGEWDVESLCLVTQQIWSLQEIANRCAFDWLSRLDPSKETFSPHNWSGRKFKLRRGHFDDEDVNPKFFKSGTKIVEEATLRDNFMSFVNGQAYKILMWKWILQIETRNGNTHKKLVQKYAR